VRGSTSRSGDRRSDVAVGRSGVPGRLHVHNTLVVADAPKVVVRSIGKEDVGAQIDSLRRALEAPTEAGKRREVHGGVDGDEHVGVLRTGLSVASEPSRAIRRIPGDDLAARTKASTALSRWPPWVGNRGLRLELPSLRILSHGAL
jgi:hypothetical protein